MENRMTLEQRVKARVAERSDWAENVRKVVEACGNATPEQVKQRPVEWFNTLWRNPKFANAGQGKGVPPFDRKALPVIRDITAILADRSKTLGDRITRASSLAARRLGQGELRNPFLLRTLLILEGGRYGSIATKEQVNALLDLAGKPSRMDWKDASSIDSALRDVRDLLEEWSPKVGATTPEHRAMVPWILRDEWESVTDAGGAAPPEGSALSSLTLT